MSKTRIVSRRKELSEAGFTMIELLVAMAIFSIIAAAAFSLFAQHVPLFNQQQSLAALNIGTRNAVAQMQVDVVNGGAGYYNGVNIPGWPVGTVITNNVVASSGDCHSGTTYGANCFDSFAIIIADPLTTPVNVLAGTSGSLPVVPNTCPATTTNTSTSTNLYLLPPTGVTAATYKGNFFNGDQILLEKGDGSSYTTVELTANGATATVGGTTYVKLTHSTLTNADGTNDPSDDVTGMSVHSSDSTTAQFCQTDWAIRLTPILYDVDITTDSTNPTLRRTVLVKGQTPSANGVPLLSQVIGLKVGAALINGATDTTTYNFNAPGSVVSGGYNYDFTLVRSIMVSLVGRTTPVTDPTYRFRNTYDGGPYQIQGVSAVINPRNLSMGD